MTPSCLELKVWNSFEQDGCPNSDVQSKGGSKLLCVYATVDKP